MTFLISEQCLDCGNFEYFKRSFKLPICKAFPDGIPEEILTGEFDHSRKYPGQGNDILFEAVEGLDKVDVGD